MSLHKEITLEIEICQHLAGHGWLCAEGDSATHDRARALFPSDVLTWVQATQPQAWDTLVKNHGAQASETLLSRLRDQLDQRGTLDVLRHGIELLGLKQPLKLAEFKPALAINADILARYAANQLRVVRQIRYSVHSENCLDLVLFLNGVPVATAELKTDFTQSIGDAIEEALFDFQRQTGVVATIKGNEAARAVNWLRHCPVTRRSWSAPSDLSLRTRSGAQARGHAGQALCRDRR